MAHKIDAFLNYFPEFSEIVNKTIIDTYLEEALLMFDIKRCPEIGELIQFNYAAHAITKSSHNPEGMDDKLGITTSKSIGGMSESLEVGGMVKGSTSDLWFKSTPYGLNYLRLRKHCSIGALVAP